MKHQKKENKKPIYIFLHLPKNGGTSFVANLRKKIGEEKICSSRSASKLSEKQKQKIFIITGHETYYGVHKHFPNREPRYILFIRNPAERRVSQYNHDIARLNENKETMKQISFKKWYKQQINDEQVFLLNKKFKGIPGRKAPNFTNNFITKFRVGNLKFLKMLGFKLLKIFYSKRNKKQEFENAKSLIDKCWFVTTTDN
ncbi:MAG: sulfotransferase family 2 domain-containing protein, partial [Nanoarchaeota archaeon]